VDQQELVVKAIVGTTTAEWRGLRIPVKQLKVLVFSAPLTLEERPPDLPEAFVHLWDVEQITSALAVPLLRGDHPHGLIAVWTRVRRTFAEEEVRLLTRLAQQVVVAIENARLYRQVRYLAALEERDRLAREMHDNLAQALGYLNLKASLTSDLLAHGEADQARAGLVEMKQITREAYTDTREAIFNLRNTVSAGRDLMPMLREYLAEYRAHYGLDTQLVMDDTTTIEFSTDVAVQLSRIIQEALTNIRKHAQATRAWVRFDREGEQIRIVVEDNGQGFDLNATRADGEAHFGLQIMRERAASVGGTAELDPQIGRGTRVVIRVPLEPNREAWHG
jgi:signal transduction histidine kinase